VLSLVILLSAVLVLTCGTDRQTESQRRINVGVRKIAGARLLAFGGFVAHRPISRKKIAVASAFGGGLAPKVPPQTPPMPNM